ncbi:MAG: hypothetical protein AAGH87_06070 [Pseudomonadota bacterium]
MGAMSGYPPFDGLAATAAALVVILSAIISLVGASTRWRAVRLGAAGPADLCELTGITDPRELQDTFGPPDMGRVWRAVTPADIKAARRPLGHLLSNAGVDWACIAVAAASFFLSGPLMTLALVTALAAQVTSWVITARLPR